MTPILESIIRDDVPSVELLLAHGVDKDVLGPKGIDALGLAIEERKYEADGLDRDIVEDAMFQ